MDPVTAAVLVGLGGQALSQAGTYQGGNSEGVDGAYGFFFLLFRLV